ncbi:MAG TPA: hypothetical protein VMW46_03000 [Candidatus Desulfaltia sp.]|nr:hypothetical protein [Candidatus Desulfaltia sp.]
MKKDDPAEILARRDSPLIKEKDILSDLLEEKASSLFLGRFSMTEVRSVLGKKNFYREARDRDLLPLAFDLDSSDYPVQRLRIFHEEKDPEKLIVDLKIRESRLAQKDYLHLDPRFYEYDFLILEWLTLQNPCLGFTRKRPPLPGQQHPGLGLRKKVVDIFLYLARLLRKDGLLAFPAYFHNALLFSRFFHFLNPEKAAEVRAIRKAFPDIPFKHLAWIVYLNCLRREDGSVYEWRAEEQIIPLRKELKDYCDSREYKRQVKQAQPKHRFSIDWDDYEKKLDELIKAKLEDEK